MDKKQLKVGIGFATGRKNFKWILKSYIYNWKESGIVADINVSLNLFVAYDLKYKNTAKSDYISIDANTANSLDMQVYIGTEEKQALCTSLVREGLLTEEETSLLFGKGYASQRNAILYQAIKQGMDCVLFLDDDEYPLAVTNTQNTAIWSGQHVLKTHLEHIQHADITYGHHCGYISPIPHIDFSETFSEEIFRVFIQAISNDIISWEKMKLIMIDGGVTYADKDILINKPTSEIQEINHTKFISGSNLCINVMNPKRVYPFYNPPGARGEDTFLSTCLSDRIVLKVPCYAFHDGFSLYKHLLSGVLPTNLKQISLKSDQIVKRFYQACIGWMRYKPLYLYLTDAENYRDKISELSVNLEKTLPSVNRYFNTSDFSNVLKELKKFDKNVLIHSNEFLKARQAWDKLMNDC